jgi:hypothetical protein
LFIINKSTDRHSCFSLYIPTTGTLLSKIKFHNFETFFRNYKNATFIFNVYYEIHLQLNNDHINDLKQTSNGSHLHNDLPCRMAAHALLPSICRFLQRVSVTVLIFPSFINATKNLKSSVFIVMTIVAVVCFENNVVIDAT